MGIFGVLLGSWITNHYTTRASRITQRHDLYREVLFAAARIQLFAGVVNDIPWWKLWLPGSGRSREFIFRLLSEAIEPGFRTTAELALKEDQSYEQIMLLLGRLTSLQQNVSSHFSSWRREPTIAKQMEDIIGQLRDLMKADLAKMEKSR